jgi:uncharacterized protein (UPF0333 family)
MNPIETIRSFRNASKGQTALEYLLILVVALVVVALVYFWVSGTSDTATTQANAVTGNVFEQMNDAIGL